MKNILFFKFSWNFWGLFKNFYPLVFIHFNPCNSKNVDFQKKLSQYLLFRVTRSIEWNIKLLNLPKLNFWHFETKYSDLRAKIGVFHAWDFGEILVCYYLCKNESFSLTPSFLTFPLFLDRIPLPKTCTIGEKKIVALSILKVLDQIKSFTACFKKKTERKDCC